MFSAWIEICFQLSSEKSCKIDTLAVESNDKILSEDIRYNVKTQHGMDSIWKGKQFGVQWRKREQFQKKEIKEY